MEIIKVSTPTTLIRFVPDDIVFARARGNYCDVYINNGQLDPYGPAINIGVQLGELEKCCMKLTDNPFVKVGRSLLVNKNYIFRIDMSGRILTLSSSSLRLAAVVDKSSVEQRREALRKGIGGKEEEDSGLTKEASYEFIDRDLRTFIKLKIASDPLKELKIKLDTM